MEIHQIEMKRNVTFLAVVFFSIFILLIGCRGISSEPSGKWNEETSTFSIEEEDIAYKLPTDKSSWVFAQQNSLPPAMDFFAIDTVKEICVGIFHPKSRLKPMNHSGEYSKSEVEDVVREVSSPHSSQKSLDESITCRPLVNSSGRSWYFSLVRKVLDESVPADTFAINYSGYLFDTKTRQFGFVVISSADSTDGMMFELYASGLQIKR